jgi:hypothetical protein
MLSGETLGYDTTRVNIPHLPHNAQVAGYDTGSGDVPWTPADFALFKNPLHICQLASPDNPATSDYIDVENFAATFADAVEWYPRALASYVAADRPGQRQPAVYLSANNVAPMLNAFRMAGITSGPGLIVANWSITETQSELEVMDNAGDNFPIWGAQFAAGQFYDVNIFNIDWLETVSKPGAHLFWKSSAPGDTFGKIAEARDANLNNLIKRTVDNSSTQNLLNIGEAALVPGTMYATVNP